jgi:hypothetical protein
MLKTLFKFEAVEETEARSNLYIDKLCRAYKQKEWDRYVGMYVMGKLRYVSSPYNLVGKPERKITLDSFNHRTIIP